MEDSKRCSRCGLVKPLSEFYRKGAHRLQAWCKACFNRQSREWQRANRERVRSYSRTYARKNPEKVKAYRRKRAAQTREYNRQREYGITPEALIALLVAQGGGCAICDNPLDGGSDTHVDHCHTSGRVRGLLCRDCNLLLGNARNDATTLRRAAEYMEKSLG